MTEFTVPTPSRPADGPSALTPLQHLLQAIHGFIQPGSSVPLDNRQVDTVPAINALLLALGSNEVIGLTTSSEVTLTATAEFVVELDEYAINDQIASIIDNVSDLEANLASNDVTVEVNITRVVQVPGEYDTVDEAIGDMENEVRWSSASEGFAYLSCNSVDITVENDMRDITASWIPADR